MRTIDIQAKKLDLISWISEMQDVSLIEHLIGIQKNSIQIPQWHKDVVSERIVKSDKDPNRLLKWDEVKDSFKLD